MKGNWGASINGYWSPAYPSLLTATLYLFKPAISRELVVVHCLNCAILLGALASFEYFLRGLLGYTSKHSANEAAERVPMPQWALRAIGYVLFFWATLYATPPSLENPDALVFALALLAGGILLRIAAGANRWVHFAGVGVVLGASYLAKAVMFPLSFVFLAVAFFGVGNFRRAAPRIVVALLTFVLVAGPFVVALSKSKGRFTFGDSGRINYAEFVNGVPRYIHWQGEPAGSGTPVHPTRRILETPPVYEFATPLGGSYPPSTDQSYWYEGIRPHFEVKGQLAALRLTLDDYFNMFVRLGSVFGVFFVLLIFGGTLGEYGKHFAKMYFLWVPSVAALGLYSLVHVELRFVSGFLVLLWGAAFGAARIPRSASGKAISNAGTLAILLLLGAQIVWSMGHSVPRLLSSRGFPASEIADGLRRMGVEAGDRIACIGESPSDHYWARLAGVTIVAEVPADGVSSFIMSSAERKRETLHALGGAGAKFVVALNLPQEVVKDGWIPIGGTNYSVFVLPE